MSDIKFTVQPESLTIMEVFERYKHHFPVLIQVTQGYHGDTDDDTYSTGHVMRIHAFRENRHTYEAWLLAKSIVGGALAVKVLSVSIYLDIVVSMISGIEGRTESGYQKFLRNLNRSADRIHFGTSKRNDDRYSSESEDDYDYIQPQHNHTYRETHDRKPPIPRLLNVQEITDRLSLTMSDIKFTVRPESLTIKEVFKLYQHSFPVLLQVIQGHHGETDCDTYSTGHGFWKLLYVPAYIIGIVVSVITGIEGRTESEYQKFLEHMNRSADVIYFGTSGGYDKYDGIKASAKSEDDFDDRFENKPEVIPKPTSTNPRTYGNPYSSDQTTNNEKAPPLPKRMAAPKPPEHHHYVNTTLARAMVKPLEQACTPTSGSGSSSRPSAAEDVGSSTCFVRGLSINQLADRLESLNLGKYSQTFKDAQICGDLLIDLDETALRDDFGMKRYEAIKLMKYARTGFVPK